MYRVVTKQESASAFFAWFFGATWNVDDVESQALQELVFDIELAHAEWTDNHIADDEMVERLAAMLRRAHVRAAMEEALTRASARVFKTSARSADVPAAEFQFESRSL